MFSILIPVYEVDVRPLVAEILKICRGGSFDFQIIVMDDGSSQTVQETNRSISEEFGVSYLTLENNVGRAKIRNKLAQLARYENIIFLDCDSVNIPSTYLDKYALALKAFDIVDGGRNYDLTYDANTQLHQLYGSKRESKSAAVRNKNAVLNFMTNNFAIKSGVFSNLKFDETLEGYGYEDIAFAQAASDKGYKIGHIDNSISHGILDNDEKFLQKIDQSIINLVHLVKSNKLKQTRLISTHNKVRWILKLTPSNFLSSLEAITRNNVSRKSNILLNLDLYKLLVYNRLISKD